MIGRTEIQHSLDMIDRSEKRLSYQRIAVKKLSLDRDPRCADLARDMEAIMEEKVALLKKKHAAMVVEFANL